MHIRSLPVVQPVVHLLNRTKVGHPYGAVTHTHTQHTRCHTVCVHMCQRECDSTIEY